jgi:hypothetical protein
VSAARTGERLLRFYPPAWRRRYGEELAGLIVEASDGGRVPWRTRLDVALAGGRERVRSAGLEPGDSPAERVRARFLLVLCAWALLVLGGAVAGKFSEHWRDAVPAGGSGLASAAFTVLIAAAGWGSALVLAGVAAAVPSFLRSLPGGGWGRVRRPLAAAALAGLALVAATAALALWAGGLSSAQREGGDAAYSAAFVVWALLVAGTIATCAGAAVAIAGRIELPDRLLRLEAWLAAGATVAMAAVTAATLVWWIALADAAPWFFSGAQARSSGGSTLAPQLLAAAAVMVAATLLAAGASRHLLRDLPALHRRQSS